MDITPGSLLGHYEVVEPADDSPRPTRFVVRERARQTMHTLEVVERLDVSTRTRLLNEAAAQGRLRHPNIHAVTEVLELDGDLGLVSAHVEGISLAHVLSDGEPLARADALRLFGQMCDAINAAHAGGVIHRGLDPESVLVVVDGDRADARVSGFGRSAMIRERAPSLASGGYTAPELLRDPKSQDPRIDVFSLGALLYELLCGHPAFRDSDPTRSGQAILAGRYLPLDQRTSIPAAAARVVDKALSTDPNQRFGTVRELQKAVAAVSGALLAPPLRKAEPGEATADRPPVTVAPGAGRPPVAKASFGPAKAAVNEEPVRKPVPVTAPPPPPPASWEDEEATSVFVPGVTPRVNTLPPTPVVPPTPVAPRAEPPLPAPVPPRAEAPRPVDPPKAAPTPVVAPTPPAKPPEKPAKPPEPPPVEGPSLIGRLFPLFLVIFLVASVAGTIWSLAAAAAGEIRTSQDALAEAGLSQVDTWRTLAPTFAAIEAGAHDRVALDRALDAYRDADSPSVRVDTGEAALRVLQVEAARQGGGAPRSADRAALEKFHEVNKAYQDAFLACRAAEEATGTELALSFGLVASRVEGLRPLTLPPLTPPPAP